MTNIELEIMAQEFALINEILHNPEVLVQDEATWQATKIKQVCMTVMIGHFKISKFEF